MKYFFLNTTRAFQLFQLARYGFLLLAAILLARILPDSTLIARYETLLLLAGSINSFWISGLFDSFLPLSASAKSKAEQSAILKNTLNTGIGAGIAGGLLVAAGGWFFYPKVDPAATAAFAAFQIFHSAGFLTEYYLLARNKPVLLLVSGTLYYSFYVVGLALPLWWGLSFSVSMSALALLAAIRFLLLFVAVQPEIRQAKVSRSIRSRQWSYTWPAAVALLVGGSAPYIDGFLVRSFYNEDTFVLFSYGARELPLALLLANALSATAAASIAGSFRKDPSPALAGLRLSSSRLLHQIMPVSILLLIFSRQIFGFVFGDRFAGSSIIFDIFLLLTIPRLLFPQAVIRGFMHSGIILKVAAAELALNAACSIILMQFMGTPGIAAGTVIAYSAERAVLAWWCRKNLGVEFTAYTNVRVWLAWSLALAAVFTVKMIVYAGWISFS